MFKVGEIAKIRSDGRLVTITHGTPSGGRWLIATSEGAIEEGDLLPAQTTSTGDLPVG